MSEKIPLNNFKWIEKDDISNFNENFIKNYDENSDEGYIFEADVEYSKNLHAKQRLAILTRKNEN